MMEFSLTDDEAAAEAEAALALGRLDGALRHLPAPVERLLAARLLRETLVAALRQEGHAFTLPRFHAWLAGLAPLDEASEPTHQEVRPPRALVMALLTALSHSPWAPLASLATQFAPAVLAMPDSPTRDAYCSAHEVLTEARALLHALAPPPSPLPFAVLSRLHGTIAASTTFAPGERGPRPLGPAAWGVTIERSAAPVPRWALEAQLGAVLHTTGLLPLALPCPDLVRLDALGHDADSRFIRAAALRDTSFRLAAWVDDAHRQAHQLDALRSPRRSTSRMPALFEALVGFGPMRSAQLEVLLGATRLGVRGILTTLQNSGVLSRETVAGAHLYCLAVSPPQPTASSDLPLAKALHDFDAAMADIDANLARLGVFVDESEE
jgi:hypothetical protein